MKALVEKTDLPQVLVAYAHSLRFVSIFATGLAVIGAIFSVGIKWISVKKKEEGEKTEKDVL